MHRLITTFFFVLLTATQAHASGSHQCSNESPVWSAMYDRALTSTDPYERGRAFSWLRQWSCDPVFDNEGNLVPNPNCTPPPNCGMNGGTTDRIPGGGVIPGGTTMIPAISQRVGRVPPYVPPTYDPDPNRVGSFLCRCSRFSMAVGETQNCVATGTLRGSVVWSTTGNIIADDLVDDRTVSIRAISSGVGSLMIRDMQCSAVYVTPRTPSLQDQTLQAAIAEVVAEAAADIAAAREEASEDAEEQIENAEALRAAENPPWWKTGGGVASILTAVGATVAVVLSNQGGN